MADGKPSTPVQPELDEVRQLTGGGTAQTAPPAVKFDDEEEFTDGDDVHVRVQTRLARNSSMNQVRGKLEAHGSSSRVTDPNSSSVFEPNLHATSTAIGKQRSACENMLWYVQTYSLPLLLGVVVGMVMANFSEPLYEELKHFEIIPADTFALFDHGVWCENYEFCIKNEKLFIKNEKLCIKNEEFCIKNDGFCRLLMILAGAISTQADESHVVACVHSCFRGYVLDWSARGGAAPRLGVLLRCAVSAFLK